MLFGWLRGCALYVECQWASGDGCWTWGCMSFLPQFFTHASDKVVVLFALVCAWIYGHFFLTQTEHISISAFVDFLYWLSCWQSAFIAASSFCGLVCWGKKTACCDFMRLLDSWQDAFRSHHEVCRQLFFLGGGGCNSWIGQLKSRQETGEREEEWHAAKGHRWNQTRGHCGEDTASVTLSHQTPLFAGNLKRTYYFWIFGLL